MADLIKAHAYIEGVDQSNRKVAIVASLVRRRAVADALVILSHVPRPVSYTHLTLPTILRV